MVDPSQEGTQAEVADDNTGLLSSDDIRTGFITGTTFETKAVQYAAVGGLAMFEGDICLGTVEEMDRRAAAVATAHSDDDVAHGVAITGDQYRWPNALVPYDIDDALPNKGRVTDAIAHWEEKTNIRFVLRTPANAAQYPNYVHVFKGDGCWSYVGMQTGRQNLSLANGCGLGAAIHEFGHAIGLWHEQSREDRDAYVSIQWANISPGKESNFNQHISDGDDIGGYDYGSIMHYGRFAFSKNNQPTILQLQGGPTIGQRNGLSAGDIAAAHAIYRTTHHNLTIRRVYATPHSMNAWALFTDVPGWRRVKNTSTDGVTNTLSVLAAARANGRRVHATLDGTWIYAVYGV